MASPHATPTVDLSKLGSVDVWLDAPSICPAVRIGSLHRATTRTGQAISFEYSPEWLEMAPLPGFALDEQLPLYPGRHIAAQGAAEVTPSLEDCSPDRWGRLLMERREAMRAAAEGRRPRALRAWDFLLGVNDQGRMGALRFIDPESTRYLDDSSLSAPPVTELRTLEEYANRLERGADSKGKDELKWMSQLIVPGSSLGGARPKASFIEPDGQPWMAKFPSSEDTYDVGLWEFITFRVALDAGIQMPEAKLLKLSTRGHTFAVRRFDRNNAERIHYASAKSLLNAPGGDEASYEDLAHVISTRGTSGSVDADLQQLFRRAVFNVLVGNRDDHLRNHGFLRQGNGWRLSPAFDVNPNPHKDVHVLALAGDDPSPDTKLVERSRKSYGLSASKAASVISEVRLAVADWEKVARQAGAHRAEIMLMRAVINPAR